MQDDTEGDLDAPGDTFEDLPRTDAVKPISTKFVFSRERNQDGSICRCIERLEDKGYLQGVVMDTCSPVVDFAAMRTAMAVSVQNKMCLNHLDVRIAFLHGNIDRTLHITPPVGLEATGIMFCSSTEILQLKKGLYGLKQAPKGWNMKWGMIIAAVYVKSLR